MDRCYVWDMAAGEKFSVFLMDRDGFQPEIHYVGKHPWYQKNYSFTLNSR
jgi:hypothetical protein